MVPVRDPHPLFLQDFGKAMDRVRLRLTGLLLLLCALPGCAVVDVGVRNPVPGLESVAVAPFFNLSQERTVDGREFALAYYSELQKVPGFEVLPVGVAERAMLEHGLTMQSPDDALQLARILGVDAVVIGAITDYDPYSPRVGLKVAWYSPRQWLFLPNSPGEKFSVSAMSGQQTPTLLRAQSPQAGTPESAVSVPEIDEGNWVTIDTGASSFSSEDLPDDAEFLPPRRVNPDTAAQPAVPPQTARTWPAPTEIPIPAPRSIPSLNAQQRSTPAPKWTGRSTTPSGAPVRISQLPQGEGTSPSGPVSSDSTGLPQSALAPSAQPGLSRQQILPGVATGRSTASQTPQTLLFAPPREAAPDGSSGQSSVQSTPLEQTVPALVFDDHVILGRDEFNPREPLMAYVRMFDSTDARLVARLADYLELSGETRSGDLEAYMKRSDFFRKFTAHVMISEMLMLHGGESRRRFLLKQRRYQ